MDISAPDVVILFPAGILFIGGWVSPNAAKGLRTISDSQALLVLIPAQMLHRLYERYAWMSVRISCP